LDLPRPKQVQLLTSDCINGKFHLSTTSTFVGFQENMQQFILQAKTSLKGEAFVILSTIILNDNV
jgi:hypothetical protein